MEILKKNKEEMEEYMKNIQLKHENVFQTNESKDKITNESIVIPKFENYSDIIRYNYNLTQLKLIAKNYKIKLNGNKNELVSRIFYHLFFSYYLIKIQKIFRGFIVKKYIEYRGPAILKRDLCNNSEDFVTMDPIEKINFHQFFSYKDMDGFIYGFDIISFHNLVLKSKDVNSVQNPYNRNIIPENVIKSLKYIIKIGRILKININLIYKDDTQSVSNEKAVELRALNLFQNIDSLGNYSNYKWFLSLNRYQVVKFIKELSDIWNYRAELSHETKRNVCPPNGDPFRNLSVHYLNTESNMCNIKNVTLEVLERFVNIGINNDSKSLGAYYVLGALTLVNSDAAIALPWLFQSFAH